MVGGTGGTSSPDGTPFVPGSTQGTPIEAYDPTTGDLVVVEVTPGTRILAVNAAVTVTPVQSNTSSAPAQTAVGTTAVQVLAANSLRKRFMLQNVGTTVIKVVLGATSPTETAYHFALPMGGIQNDGSSPVWQDTMWTGAIQAISSAAGGLLLVTELT